MLIISKSYPAEKSPDVMVYLDNQRTKSFRCSCGCNVFRHPTNRQTGKLELKKYVCNSCSTLFHGE